MVWASGKWRFFLLHVLIFHKRFLAVYENAIRWWWWWWWNQLFILRCEELLVNGKTDRESNCMMTVDGTVVGIAYAFCNRRLVDQFQLHSRGQWNIYMIYECMYMHDVSEIFHIFLSLSFMCQVDIRCNIIIVIVIFRLEEKCYYGLIMVQSKCCLKSEIRMAMKKLFSYCTNVSILLFWSYPWFKHGLISGHFLL